MREINPEPPKPKRRIRRLPTMYETIKQRQAEAYANRYGVPEKCSSGTVRIVKTFPYHELIIGRGNTEGAKSDPVFTHEGNK